MGDEGSLTSTAYFHSASNEDEGSPIFKTEKKTASNGYQCAWVYVWESGFKYLCKDQCPVVHSGWSEENPEWCFGDFQDYIGGDCAWIGYSYSWKSVKNGCCPGARRG